MGAVEVLVVGHDDVGVARDAQAGAVEALALERVELLEHDLRVDDAAVANDGEDAVIHDARRDLVQRELVAVGDDGVAGVGTSLVANNAVEVTRDEVGDLALTLVAPLSTNEH